MPAAVGKPAPAFSLPTETGAILSLEELRGGPVILYFYPADDTPGCTAQACGLRDDFPDFRRLKATILGVSPDTVASHAKFKAKYELPFTLLADTDHAVAQKYGVWRKKKMFGREYMGVVRTTFVIDSQGIVRHIMLVKRVGEHADAVKQVVKTVGV